MNDPKDTYKQILNDLGKVYDNLLRSGNADFVLSDLSNIMEWIEDEYYACDKAIFCGASVGEDQDGFVTAYAKSSECSNEDIRALSRFPGRVCYI